MDSKNRIQTVLFLTQTVPQLEICQIPLEVSELLFDLPERPIVALFDREVEQLGQIRQPTVQTDPSLDPLFLRVHLVDGLPSPFLVVPEPGVFHDLLQLPGPRLPCI